MRLFTKLIGSYLLVVVFTTVSCENLDANHDSTTKIPLEVSITFPENGTIISQSVEVIFIVSDSNRVEKVELWIDSVAIETNDSFSPNSFEWDTTLLDNESVHTIMIRVYDIEGDISDSTPISVTIANLTSLWFERTAGGEYYDQANSVRQTADLGYVAVGQTQVSQGDNPDVFIVKWDSLGNEQWAISLGGAGFDIGYDIRQTTDEGYIVVGSTDSFGAGHYDIWLIKTDPNGTELWTKTFGGSQADLGSTVILTNDGGYIISGSTSSFGDFNVNTWIIKTDSNGNEMWNIIHGGYTNEKGTSIQQTSDGGLIVVGQIFFGNKNVLLLKTDKFGEQVWWKSIGGDYDQIAHSVCEDNDGGFLVFAQDQLAGAWLFKTDDTGEIVWERMLSEAGQTLKLTDGKQTLDGGYIITGYVIAPNAENDVFILKTDNQGYEVWRNTFGGHSHDYGQSVSQTGDGGYIIAGGTQSFGAGDSDVWLIKTDSEGNSQ